MNKKVIIIIVILVIICLALFGIKLSKTPEKGEFLFDFLGKEEFDVDEIELVNYIRYTEGGDNLITYTERDNIESLYNTVKSIKVGKETNRACEDNTTVYSFKMRDGTDFTVEVECSWLVLNNKRYEIVKD